MTSSKLIVVAVLSLAALAARAEHANLLSVPEDEMPPARRVPYWPDEHRRIAPAFADEPVATFGSIRNRPAPAAPAKTVSRGPASVVIPAATPTVSPLALTYAPPVDVWIPPRLRTSAEPASPGRGGP